jgi:CRP-like cAMP-binding protein
MEAETVEKVLGRVPLFRSLRPNDVRRLAELATVRTYKADAVIVKQDDTAVALYCVLSGKVRVERQGSGAETVTLAEMGPGAFFGEMALFDEFPRSASVVAVAPTECALISKWDFDKELKAHPEISRALLRVLCRRVRELDERLSV